MTTKKTKKKKNMELFNDRNPISTIHNTGFKDKETALKTLQLLKYRDIDYQFQVINTMFYRCKYVIQKTKDKEKIKKLRKAESVFLKWLKKYRKDKTPRTKLLKKFSNYLDLKTVNNAEKLAKIYNISKKARGLEKSIKSDLGFLEVYRNVKGNKKMLRVTPIKKKIPLGQTWDKHRNNFCLRRMGMIKDKPLYHLEGKYKGLPTKLHTNMIMWACSPEPEKIKKIFKNQINLQ